MNKFYIKKFFLFAVSTSLLSLVACHSAEEIVPHGYQKSADIKDGKLVDYRDGNEYGVAEINGSYWMTENLRYADSSSMENLKGNSWCHEDDKKCTNRKEISFVKICKYREHKYAGNLPSRMATSDKIGLAKLECLCGIAKWW